MNNVVALHTRNDLDGIVACWCVEKYANGSIPRAFKPNSNYPSTISNNDTVYIFGFSFNREYILKLCSRNKMIIMFYKSESKIENLDDWNAPTNLQLISVGSSFARSISYKLKAPENRIIDYIECIFQDAPAIGIDHIEEYLSVCNPYNFEIIDSANEMLTDKFDDAVNLGRGVSIKIEQEARSILDRSREIEFEGYDALIVNCMSNFEKVAEYLAQISKSGLGITWRCCDKEIFYFSIASTESSNIDCRLIAKKNNGSGYKHKCGFRIKSFDKLKSILVCIRQRSNKM